MVVVSAPRGALRGPTAQVAVRTRQRIGIGCSATLEERRFEVAIICREVGHAERLLPVIAEHDVHPFGRAALNARDVLAIVRELDDEVRLVLQREFRIGDLVTPRPARARRFRPEQKIGLTEKRSVEERALIDDGRPGFHGTSRLRHGRFDAGAAFRRRFDLDEARVPRAQGFQVGALVLETFGGDQRNRGILFGPRAQAFGNAALERDQVAAFQIVVEIGGRIDESSVE